MRHEVASNSENSPEMKRFSGEDKRGLRKLGFLIVSLTGRSIKDLRELGFMINIDLDEKYPGFDEIQSMESEVAIYPELFFLKGSALHNLEEQMNLVEEFSKELQHYFGTQKIQAIMGQAVDYIDLAFTYPKSQRKRKKLFGKRHALDFTRTATRLSKGDMNFAVVGRNEENGLKVYGWHPNVVRDDLHVAPLIVPK